jgi:mycothiol system anti-sigma-R factor
MDCDEVRPLLDAYLDSELEKALQPDLQKHLNSCPGCRKEVEATSRLSALVRTTILMYKAPAQLKARIRASLREEAAPRSDWLSRFRRPLI